VPRENSLGCSLLAMFSTRYGFYRLHGVDLTGTNSSNDDLEQLIRLRHIKEVKLARTHVSHVGIRHLRSLPYLTNLDLGETQLTDN
jgi:hypothetical protein